MHFFNPVPVMPLVEVVRGLQTSDATAQAIGAVAARMGKTAVPVDDQPGFVANRILMPMINEAVYCLMEGVAEREAIDTVMKLGMNHPMGPLALADLIGLDTTKAVAESLYEEFKEPLYAPPPLLARIPARGARHIASAARDMPLSPEEIFKAVRTVLGGTVTVREALYGRRFETNPNLFTFGGSTLPLGAPLTPSAGSR